MKTIGKYKAKVNTLILMVLLAGAAWGQSASLMPVPRMQFSDVNGNPLTGGLVYSFLAGTSTPAPTYTDSSATILNTNPIILDSAGMAAVWLGPVSYKIIVKNSAGVQQYATDFVSNNIAAGSINSAQYLLSGHALTSSDLFDGSDLAHYSIAGVFVAPQTMLLNAENGDQYATQQAGADIGNRVATAIAACATLGCRIKLDPGTYNFSTQINLSGGKNIILEGSGRGNTVLNWTGGATPLIKASATGAGNVIIRNLTLQGAGVLSAGQYGIWLNGAQNPVNIDNVEITAVGDAGIVVDAGNALINITNCYVHLNLFNYALVVNSTSAQNVIVAGNTFYNNSGGINIQASSQASIFNNDVETGTGTGALALLRVTGTGVTSIGNTYGAGSASAMTDIATISAPSFRSYGDSFSLGKNSQVGIDILSGASNTMIREPVVSAPGTGGGVGIATDAAAVNVHIIDPVFYNALTSKFVGGSAGFLNLTVDENGLLTHGQNTVKVASNFTTAANTSLQTITGLTWGFSGSYKSIYSFDCDLSYSQGTAAVVVAFGIQEATIAPTNIFANGVQQITAGPPSTFVAGTLATLATTTATNIVSGTPGATATIYTVHLAGTIDNSGSASGASSVNIMTSTATAGDVVTVYKGSFCSIHP